MRSGQDAATLILGGAAIRKKRLGGVQDMIKSIAGRTTAHSKFIEQSKWRANVGTSAHVSTRKTVNIPESTGSWDFPDSTW